MYYMKENSRIFQDFLYQISSIFWRKICLYQSCVHGFPRLALLTKTKFYKFISSETVLNTFELFCLQIYRHTNWPIHSNKQTYTAIAHKKHILLSILVKVTIVQQFVSLTYSLPTSPNQKPSYIFTPTNTTITVYSTYNVHIHHPPHPISTYLIYSQLSSPNQQPSYIFTDHLTQSALILSTHLADMSSSSFPHPQ